MFIGSHGQMVNLAHVVQAKFVMRDGKPATILELSSGEQVTLVGHYHEEIGSAHQRLIPANPGFYLLVAWAEDGDDEALADPLASIHQVPILGWKFTEGPDPDPLLPEGTIESYGRFNTIGILWPNGHVDVPMDRTLPSIEAWIDQCVRPAWVKRREEAAKSQQPE